MAKDEIRSQQWIDQIEKLVRQAEELTDPASRSIAVDLVQAVLDFHAAGFERVLEIAAESPALAKRIVGDDLISSLLLLHDLHPDTLDTRICRAVDKLQTAFRPLGASLSLICIDNETVRLEFESTRTWPGESTRTTIENAIFQAAPEVSTVIVEGLKETPPTNFVPISDLLADARV